MSDVEEERPWFWERTKDEQQNTGIQIYADHKNHNRLPEEIIIRDPVLNYKIWDEAEIEQLEDYLRQCFSMKERHGSNPNFNQNWINCDKAIKYYKSDILTQYVNFDESVPLKRAIKTGWAIHHSSELTDEESDFLIDLNKKGYFSVDGCDDEIRKRLQSGERVRLSLKRYLLLKANADDDVRESILKNKNLLELYNE